LFRRIISRPSTSTPTSRLRVWLIGPTRHSGRTRRGIAGHSPARRSRRGALDIFKHRCKAAALPSDICNHSFRATGITLHQDAKGDMEAARQLAGHANIKTTQLYNRSGDKKQKAEVESVQRRGNDGSSLLDIPRSSPSIA
jgi:integrase